VYSLAERLGTGSTAGTAAFSAIVALDSVWGKFAVAVEGAERLEGLAASGRLALPAAGGASRFNGVVSLGDELLLSLSADGLHPAAQLAAQPEAASPAQSATAGELVVDGRARRRALLFALPNLDVEFALSYSQVLELGMPTRLWPVPGWPERIRGLVEWRGRPLPLVDLAACLGRPATPRDSVRRLLIARPARDAKPLALGIGFEVQSRSMPLTHQPWNGPSPFPLDYVRGLFEMDGRPLVVPDLDRIAAGTEPLLGHSSRS